MAKELSENTSFNVSIQTLIGIGFAITTVVGMWFALQADIAEAKQLPAPPDPEITRMEFDMQEDVKELKESIKRIEDKLDKR